MSLHDIILFFHSSLRWIVVGVAGVLFARALVRRKHEWTDVDTKALRVFVSVFDAQVLLGLIMYFGTSALGVRTLAHAKIAMKDSVLRFFAVEHIVGMLMAAVVLHVGTARARRLGPSPQRQVRTALVVGFTLLIVFASIPWPFFPYGRPLFRLAPG